MKKHNIFIDGSCLNNGKSNAVAGWAYIVVDENMNEVYREFGKIREGEQHNNRAELEALCQALIYIKQNKGQYKIYSDAEVVVLGVQGLAQRNSNRDMWENIESLCLNMVGKVDIEHINSHQKDNEDMYVYYNNLADKLAKQGANSLLIAPLKVS